MENSPSHFESFDNSKHLSDKQIFTNIFTHPKATFEYLVRNNYNKYIFILLFLTGISRALDRASLKDLGDKFSLGALILICIVAGGLLGWISFLIYSGLISWTGKWFGGKANTISVLRIFSYSSIPVIISMIFIIPQILIYGNEIFKSDGDILSSGIAGNILFYSSIIAEFILSVWSLVLLVIGISVLQKFSIGKAIINILIPIILILIVIFGFAFLFGILMRL